VLPSHAPNQPKPSKMMAHILHISTGIRKGNKMSKDAMTDAMIMSIPDHDRICSLEAGRAFQRERIEGLEVQMNSVLEHIVALEKNVGPTSVTALSIRILKLENAVRAFYEAVESLRR
jgi:hypothetical protein